ncbi:MAG: glycosyltransferase family 1 protein [Phaeodactylibacter sp.]|uniref:glycosyltransferase family 4 protein n=1 Tax=Phaeodactylibacter sp. TaxID=1940289 RepID=UPI0032ECF5B7
MRVAINTRFLLPGRIEGIGRYTYEVVRRLLREHPEHEYLFLFDRPFDPAFTFDGQAQGIVLPPPARHPLLWYLWFEWAVPVALRKHRADVFFSPDGYLSLRSKVPALMTVHDLAFEHFDGHIPALVNRYYRYYTPRFCAHASRLLAVSEYTAADVQERYHIPGEQIAVCGNACREGFRPLLETEKQAARARWSAGQPYYLYIGSIHPRKNIHRLIAAFSAFKAQTQSPAKLLIAGRFAWQAGPVKAAYEASAYQQDIDMLGFVPDEALPELLGAAKGFVYPSLFEGFGLPLLEAMHAEVPVITSSVSSMLEVAGDAALLVDPHNTDALAQALVRLDGAAELRQRLVEKGRVQRRQYSWEQTASVVYKNLELLF